MIKKIAIKKLNRTQLKKEGTKEYYVTGLAFSDLFSKKREDLSVNRSDSNAKIKFTVENSKNKEIELSLTKENNEVRLTGFGTYFIDNDIKETDELVFIVNVYNDKTENTLRLIKKNNIRVLQKYSANDNANNFDIKDRRATMKTETEGVILENYDNAYWFWDDSFDHEKIKTTNNSRINALFSYSYKGERRCDKKTIRFNKINKSFPKLMKAMLSSGSKEYTQEKELYTLEEYENNSWHTVNIDISGPWEIFYDKDRVVFTERNENSMCMYIGETLS